MSRMSSLFACACAAAVLSAASVSAQPALIWPVPASVSSTGSGSVVLAPTVQVHLSGPGAGSKNLVAAASRYTALLQKRASMGAVSGSVAAPASMVTAVQVTVASADEEPTLANSNYTVTVSGSDVAVAAPAAPGAAYGLESLLQAFGTGGSLNGDQLTVVDAPRFEHRGIMIDTGRRFFPVSVVESVLDGMAAVKMSVLHFHASDFCRESIESKVFPNLQDPLEGVLGGFYTQADIAHIVAYAAERFIRVIPEFDLPGHSQGFDPLMDNGTEFCTDVPLPRIQLYDDPANKTADNMKAFLTEMAKLFPDKVMHLGCDETSVVGSCSLANIGSLETKMQDHVQSLGKTPMGWEEVLFTTAAAEKGTIVNAWSHYKAIDVVNKGFQAVESHGGNFYLNHLSAPGQYWIDIAPEFTPAQMALMLGGEASLWTDDWCYIEQCGAFGGSSKPVGAALFGPDMDKYWAQSAMGIMWPRAAVAGGAFWNYVSTLDPSSSAFSQYVDAINEQVIFHGVDACPNNCSCDYTSRCGMPYVPIKCADKVESGMAVGNYACQSEELGAYASWTVHSDNTISLDATTGSMCLHVSDHLDPSSKSQTVDVAPCNSTDTRQQWKSDSNGHIVSVSTGKCLDITGHSSSSGAEIEVYACNSPVSANQQWQLPAADGHITSQLNDYCVAVCN